VGSFKILSWREAPLEASPDPTRSGFKIRMELFVMHENEISEKVIGAAIKVNLKGFYTRRTQSHAQRGKE
jgi:hypothetical protein